jgi:adenylate kinase
MNILFFGPNGSGKGTQGAIVQKQYHIPHIESGVIFRDNISRGTELGKKAQGYIDRGELVPDDITIPMILDRLKEPDCAKGWLLDGFPRNLNQAKKLDEALKAAGLNLSYVIEIVLDRKLAKDRIMGRRLCVNDNNHPNNVFIEAIKPAEKGGKQVCRVCGGELKTRSDDQDETAIDKRHAIYYSTQDGTLAAVNYFKDQARKGTGGLKVIELDGRPGVKEVSEELLKNLGMKG